MEPFSIELFVQRSSIEASPLLVLPLLSVARTISLELDQLFCQRLASLQSLFLSWAPPFIHPLEVQRQRLCCGPFLRLVSLIAVKQALDLKHPP